MKKAIVLFSFALAISSLSQAAQYCGVLGSHTWAPVCKAGVPCPHYYRLQYDLNVNGRTLDLTTTKNEVEQEFGSYQGQNVCVEGELQKDAANEGKVDLSVNSIELQMQ